MDRAWPRTPGTEVLIPGKMYVWPWEESPAVEVLVLVGILMGTLIILERRRWWLGGRTQSARMLSSELVPLLVLLVPLPQLPVTEALSSVCRGGGGGCGGSSIRSREADDDLGSRGGSGSVIVTSLGGDERGSSYYHLEHWGSLGGTHSEGTL